MSDQLGNVREDVLRASDATENAKVREQLRSIDEELMEMAEKHSDEEEANAAGSESHGTHLDEVEAKLAELAKETDDMAGRHIQDARDGLDAYRRINIRDW